MPKLPAKPTLKTKLQRELAPLLVPIIAEAVHTALVEAGMLQTCLHCVHFNEETEGCAKAGGLRPPAETIVFGCELFDDSEPLPPVKKTSNPPRPEERGSVANMTSRGTTLVSMIWTTTFHSDHATTLLPG